MPITRSPLPCCFDQLGEPLEPSVSPPAPDPRRARAGAGRQPRRRRHGRSRAAACRSERRATARAWPAPPTVQSTINPSGTGRRSSTTSRTITGRCENSASTSISSSRSAGADLTPAPSPAPRSTGTARDVSSGSATAESGRSRGQQPRRPRGWRRARNPGSVVLSRPSDLPALVLPVGLASAAAALPRPACDSSTT